MAKGENHCDFLFLLPINYQLSVRSLFLDCGPIKVLATLSAENLI